LNYDKKYDKIVTIKCIDLRRCKRCI